MFEKLNEILPDGGSVVVTVTRVDDGKLALSIVPRWPENARPRPALPGLSVSGSLEQLTDGFEAQLEKFVAISTDLVSSIKDVEIEAKRIKDENADKGKETPKKIKDRLAASLEKEQVEILLRSPGEEAFRNTLKEASLATLEAAFEESEDTDGVEALAKEIHKVGFRSVSEASKLIIDRLIVLYPLKEDKTKERIGKRIEKLSGETLADLGLVPKQKTMF